MDTLFMNSKNSKTSDCHRLSINLTDKTNLKRSDRYVTLSNLSTQYLRRNIKSHIRTINSKYQLQHGMRSYEMMNGLPDRSYSISDIQDCFVYIVKKYGEKAVNPSIRIYIYK